MYTKLCIPSHRHRYRLKHRRSHPNGYLFYCYRCIEENLYPFRFVRYENFWRKS